VFCLSPYDGDVGVVLDDLIERGQVDARQAADLVGAVAAREQPPDAERLAAREPHSPAWSPYVHWEPENVLLF
jgi:hypothetical protein